MISTITVILLIWWHTLADFFLQTDKMAINKSKSNKWLTIHIAIYTAAFLIFGWKFALINGIGHWITDWLTSRATSYLWSVGERHWFFCVIGVDQAIHLSILVLTIPFMIT